ncbi:MAG: flagellar type III secretion system protein FliR [Caulobacterales bacterium]|nr:flagellar type III secretion system protein FliR [Caulobacterales bacterium]
MDGALTGTALSETAFAAGLVFARVGGLVMLAPGFGEPGVPMRMRLAFALMLALAVGPVVAPDLPPMPAQPIGLAGLVITELLIGLAIGGIARFFFAALAVAGQIIGMQSGLAMAQNFDPTIGQQGAVFGAFLNVTGLAMLFALDLHHLFLQGIGGSYAALAPGTVFPSGDFAELALGALADAFTLGAQLAAPVFVFGLVFYAGMGVLSRLMPQAQVFFIAMPATVLMSIAILAATIGAIMLMWTAQLESFALELV